MRVSKKHEAIVTTLSSREFNRDPSSAKAAAANGPLFITKGGQPAHALLTEAPAQPTTDFHVEPPRMGTLAEFLRTSPLRGANIDIAREREAPRDIEL
jgi:hypothetical protein